MVQHSELPVSDDPNEKNDTDAQTGSGSEPESESSESRTPQNRGPIVVKTYPVARQATNNEAKNTIDLADEIPFSI